MKIIKKVAALMLLITILAGNLPLRASAAEQLIYGIGFVNASSLRLRKDAGTSSEIITTAYRGECVVVLECAGDWYKVNYNLQEGYMHSSYLAVSRKENAELGYGEISTNGVNLRSGPGTSYDVSAVSSKGEKCYIIGLNDGWYKVIYGEKIAYIRSDFVELTEIPYENKASVKSPKFFRQGISTGIVPSAAALNGVSSSGSAVPSAPAINGTQILMEAKKYLGAPYRSGGASPDGFDCAGFVYYVLKQVGYSPYRTPASQYQMGTSVSKSDLQAGDLVFFSGTGADGISHVGIYAGGGQFIHAPNSRSVVSYSDLTSGYWSNHYLGARRMT